LCRHEQRHDRNDILAAVPAAVLEGLRLAGDPCRFSGGARRRLLPVDYFPAHVCPGPCQFPARLQLEHLAEASELSNVEVRIYPMNGEQPSLATGAFSYMQFPQVHDVPLHDIVSIEHLEGTDDLEDEDQTYMYRVAYEYLKAGAFDPERSRSLISATAADIWA